MRTCRDRFFAGLDHHALELRPLLIHSSQRALSTDRLLDCGQVSLQAGYVLRVVLFDPYACHGESEHDVKEMS